MAENFKLPGSSYDELIKIIKAYATNKVGTPMSLESVAQTTGMDKTVVSRNNGFLVQVALISEGNKKSPTQLGNDLGRAYSFNMVEQVVRIWRSAIEADEFLSRMLSAIRIRNGMEKSSFINHILYSSGSSTNNNTRAGANTIIEIYKTAQLVAESDGKITAIDVDSSSRNVENERVDDTQSTILQPEVAKITAKTIKPSHANLTININLDVSLEDIDALPEKLKNLINSLNDID